MLPLNILMFSLLACAFSECRFDPNGQGYFTETCGTNCSQGLCFPFPNNLSRKNRSFPCKCREDICQSPVRKGDANYAWVSLNSPRDCAGWSPVECKTRLVTPQFYTNDTSPIFSILVVSYTPGIHLKVADSDGTSLLNEESFGSETGRIIISDKEEFFFSSRSEGNRACTKTFNANLYPSFCSSQNGVIELPQETRFEPYQPLISNNYLPKPIEYRSHANCSWVFKDVKRSVKSYKLYFQEFDLKPGATIQVFYRNSSGGIVDHLFDQFRGPTIISSQQFERIVFTTKEGPPGLGFKADLTQESCPARALLSVPTARISDGSLPGVPYQNNVHCSWLIRFDKPSPIQLTWEYFLLRESDLLAFYQGSDEHSPLLFLLSGANANMSLTGLQREIFVVFKTSDGPSPPWQGILPFRSGFAFTYQACTGICQACVPGTYFDHQANACLDCPLFTVSDQGHTSCSPCPNGTFWVSTTKCELCPKGSSSNGHSCYKCPEGLVAPGLGSPECVRCPRGFISPDNIICVPCPEGHTTNHEGLCVDNPDRINYSIIGYAVCTLVGLLILGALIMIYYKHRNNQQRQDFDDWDDIQTPWRV